MDGEVGDEEIDVLCGAEGDHLALGKVFRPLLHTLPQLGVVQRLIPSDHSRLIRIEAGVLRQIVF